MVDSIIQKATSSFPALQLFNFAEISVLPSSNATLTIVQLLGTSYGLTKKYQQKLQVIQSKMVRFILDLSPRDHVGQAQLHSLIFLDIQNRTRQLRLNH